jgi:N-acetylglucosamine kinase-like BadF-type ATPase
MSDPLATYLNDHMAGASLAIDLLKAMKKRHDDESLSQFATSILVEVEEDEETLRSFAKNIGSGSNVFKEAAAWLAEKASRFKARGEFIRRFRYL